jgi:hypothetical protein
MRFHPRLINLDLRPLVFCLCLIVPAAAQSANDAVNWNGEFHYDLAQLLLQPGFSSPSPTTTAGPTLTGTSPSVTSPQSVKSGDDNLTVTTTVEVNAAVQSLQQGSVTPYQITQQEVLSSAGSFGDFTRYLQVLPGVVWNSDESDDLIVRGGHPSENLYVIDGIEIPNINHIEVEGSTGGFTSMIDTSSIGTVDLNSGAYDTRYSSRLSSLVDIHTRAKDEGLPFDQVSVGFGGAGGLSEYPIGNDGSLFLSGHRSLLNLVSNNVGMDGAPVYYDGLARLELARGDKDKVSILSVNGADSLSITPCAGDPGESLLVDTQYAGIRSSGGAVWQHVHTSHLVSTITGSYSDDSHGIDQQLQNPGATEKSWATGNYCQPTGLTQVYLEKTSDRLSSLEYNMQYAWKNWLASIGESGKLTNLNYNVAQPQGQQSPFSLNPAWTDADSFRRNFTVGQTASYAEITGQPVKRWTLMAGAREETFALTGARTFNPRGTASYRINAHQSIHGSWNRSSQLAPIIDILAFPQNALLKPARVDQISFGADLWRTDWLSARVEVFQKHYTREPVSTEYPSLMLANMVDTLGQEFVWLPLRTGGFGRSQGIESMIRAHWKDRVEFLGTATYSRTKYAAGDGILRPGNYDLPLVGNGLITAHLPKALVLSVRDSYTSGHPYTPYDIAASEAQLRGIYDMTQVNAKRGDAYNRFDFDIGHAFHIGGGVLTVNGGVQNAFDRGNFLGYLWLDRCQASEPTSNPCFMNGLPEAKVMQMPHFPIGMARYTFRPFGRRSAGLRVRKMPNGS